MSGRDPLVVVGPAGLDSRAVGILLVCTIVWGGNLVAMKVGLEGFPPFLQSGLRSLLSGLLVSLAGSFAVAA